MGRISDHLLESGAEELGRRLHYRGAREREHGHDPQAGRMTVMLHTFIASRCSRCPRARSARDGTADF